MKTSVDTAKLDGLLARCRREVDEGILPACQVAVAKDGEILAFQTFGAATDDSRFLVFSVTKAFVASAIWLLLSEGELDVDRRVAGIVPALCANGKDAITVEQLLLHTAGLPQAFLDPFDWDDHDARDATFASWELEWEPGTRYAYHPVSAAWLWAAIIEELTGRDFRAFIRERVIEPLGLRTFQLGCAPSEQAGVPDAVLCGEAVTEQELMDAWGIPQVPDDWKTQELLLFLNDPGVRSVGIPAGGAVSTAADVAAFYQAVLRNELWEDGVLGRATGLVAEMTDDLGIPATRGLGVQVCGDHGFGWWYGFGKGNAASAFGHDGAGGQIAWADPETGVSFCYLTNGLDENILRQKRRMLAIGSRAAALGRQP